MQRCAQKLCNLALLAPSHALSIPHPYQSIPNHCNLQKNQLSTHFLLHVEPGVRELDSGHKCVRATMFRGVFSFAGKGERGGKGVR
jgi:hypothetical protein